MAFDGKPQDFVPAPVEADPVAAVIVRARELLSDPDHWFKGGFCNADESAFCLVGALRVAAGLTAMAKGAADRLSAPAMIAHTRIMNLLPRKFEYPFQYNDHPDTTHADILALLDRAAAGGGQ